MDVKYSCVWGSVYAYCLEAGASLLDIGYDVVEVGFGVVGAVFCWVVHRNSSFSSSRVISWKAKDTGRMLLVINGSVSCWISFVLGFDGESWGLGVGVFECLIPSCGLFILASGAFFVFSEDDFVFVAGFPDFFKHFTR